MHEDRVIKPGGNNRRIYQARGTLSIICELISEPLALLRQGEVIGELAGRSSPIGVCQSYPARLDMDMDMDLRNILRLVLAYNIYTRCKRVPVHWTSIRDVDQQE